ncbi:DUF5343 domain-containing protein [Dehalococcoidia bacterium]|nr:DUF5343 domain-containing protein [Dehalococcoidia bacterium]MCL0093842.1 DUF5343 domain-containing protein [Dehalococcoidia bacterium]
MVKPARTAGQGLTLPYGPTRGMLQALQLMRKSTPPKVDGNLLRRNQIAPGNEYKVVGALKFLGIIDDEGRPTEKSRLLKTKGPSFTSALRNIIRSAYKNLFQRLNGGAYTAEDIYNYFVTDEDLTPEMATKTTRFFIQLCQLAEIDLGLTAAERKKSGSNGHRKQGKGQYSQTCPGPGPGIGVCPMIETGNLNHIPLVLALTPEMASMDSEQLAEFFKKLKTALAKANGS